jgi:hypothetical protein
LSHLIVKSNVAPGDLTTSQPLSIWSYEGAAPRGASAGWRKVAATRLLRDGMISPTDRGLELTPDIAASLAFGEPLEPN